MGEYGKRVASIMMGAATLVGGVATPQAPAALAQGTGITSVYIAPRGECSDNGKGTKDDPVCDLSQAASILEREYNKGGARSDTFVRFLTGHDDDGNERVYKPTIGQKSGAWNFTFSPAASTKTYLVPDWFQPGMDTRNNPQGDMIKLEGTGVKGRGNILTEDSLGITVTPRFNRGGTYQVSGFHISNFLNSVLIQGGVSYTDAHEPDAHASRIAHGVVRGSKAPVDKAVISGNIFENIGNRFADGYNSKGMMLTELGNGSVRFWNTTNLELSNNHFKNTYNDKHIGLGHVIYGYTSGGATVKDNIFENSNMTVVHSRMSHQWNVSHNKFINTTKAELSTWYRVLSSAPNDRYAECRYDPPLYENRGNIFSNGATTSFRGLSEFPWCTDKNRVYPPSHFTAETSNKNLRLDWGISDTNGVNIAGYEVFVGTNEKDTIRVASTGAAQRSVQLSEQDLRSFGVNTTKQFHVYVQAVSESGSRSSRTANLTHVNLQHNGVARSHSWDKKMLTDRAKNNTGRTPIGRVVNTIAQSIPGSGAALLAMGGMVVLSTWLAPLIHKTIKDTHKAFMDWRRIMGI